MWILFFNGKNIHWMWTDVHLESELILKITLGVVSEEKEKYVLDVD